MTGTGPQLGGGTGVAGGRLSGPGGAGVRPPAAPPDGGGGGPGADLLATLAGWWDARDYIGSGAVVNKGTVAGLDLTVTGATFTESEGPDGNHFTLDGVNDSLTAPSDATFALTGSSNFHAGVIMSMTGLTPKAFGAFIACGAFAGTRWYVASNNLAKQDYSSCGVSQPSPTITGDMPTGLFVNSLAGNRTASKWELFFDDTSAAVNGTPYGGITVAAAGLEIGKINTGNFQNFHLYGAFYSTTVLDTAALALIAAEYGIT